MAAEIERKYLIRRPKIADFADSVLTVQEIEQTYLAPLTAQPEVERRVRKVTGTALNVKYTFTQKTEISKITREELEEEISAEKYAEYLKQADPELNTIRKTRYKMEYKEQLFEMDFYTFSEDLAILEIELKSEQEEVKLPRFIEVVREVTGEKKYKNHSLARSPLL